MADDSGDRAAYRDSALKVAVWSDRRYRMDTTASFVRGATRPSPLRSTTTSQEHMGDDKEA